jgi:ABC-type bacteriocin/lantibiotic exporter with double-glycine peptidase domain
LIFVGRTRIVITHDRWLVGEADEVCMLRAGKVIRWSEELAHAR